MFPNLCNSELFECSLHRREFLYDICLVSPSHLTCVPSDKYCDTIGTMLIEMRHVTMDTAKLHSIRIVSESVHRVALAPWESHSAANSVIRGGQTCCMEPHPRLLQYYLSWRKCKSHRTPHGIRNSSTPCNLLFTFHQQPIQIYFTHNRHHHHHHHWLCSICKDLGRLILEVS
jgi:hypothetical protein